MKYFFTTRSILLFITFSVTVNVTRSQMGTTGPNGDSLIHANNIIRLVVDSTSITEERLVQLALQRPLYKQLEFQKKISQHELSKAKNAWLDLLSISANYNDQTFAPKSNNQTNYVYPKYYFGLTIPLGLIFNSSSNIKIANENLSINTLKQEELARSVRAEVLSKYKQYRAYDQLLAIQNQIINDQKAEFLQTEQKFSDGTVTIDVYNAASKAYNTELVNRINIQLQQDLVKLDLEEMIGMKLEDALKSNTGN